MTPEYESMLVNYAGSLVQLYLATTDEDFPLDASKPPHEWIAPLGLPRPSYWCKFGSRDELWGRILMLCQLVGAESLKGVGDGAIEVKL